MSLHQITEDYVSFEVAKLLKEKGFNYTVHQYYKENGEVCNNPKSVASWRVKIWCPCATLQMAMKWLREMQGINIYARAVWKDVEVQYGDWEPAVVGYNWFVESLLDDTYSKMSIESFLTYEQSAESAIKYCLENLI